MPVTRRRATTASLTAVAVLALAACSSGTSGGTSSSSAGGAGAGSSAAASSSPALAGSITVFAAASLTGSFTQIGKDFQAAHPGTTVKFNFAASSTLATQITQGAPADVFASAAQSNMDAVVKAGEASGPKDFVSNTAEVAVPAANPAGVTTLADLAKSSVKVAVCQPQVPCGVLATTVFQKAGITVQPVTQEADVKSTLAKVTAGEVDAGVVYVTDVRAAGAAVKGIEIPADQNASTEYPIVPLAHSANAAVADAFVQFVLSDAGQKTLSAAGFAAP